MKSSTIWETASRPLFVRTVWLEGSELRRGLQRYFLLDYDTQGPSEKLNSLQHKRPDNSHRYISLELNDFTDFDSSNAGDEEVCFIGSAKAKLHEPYKLSTNKKWKPLKHRRRCSMLNRQYPSYEGYNFAYPNDNLSGRSSDISRLHSRKNSTIDYPQPSAETADVLLADRVLHWLDLAGEEDLKRNMDELKEMEVKLSKTCKLRQDAIKRYNSKAQNEQKTKPQKAKSCERAAMTAPPTSSQRNHKSAEPVKHITIIFNKEGQPIRLNRPAKNIDLCALSNSPRTTRRLAGTLASARLYKSSESSYGLNVPKRSFAKSTTRIQGSKSLSACRRLDTVADLNNSTLQKRLHESPMQKRYNNPNDSKKQLHIFMPTLLKRGFNKSVYGTEDCISELSHNFSELCGM